MKSPLVTRRRYERNLAQACIEARFHGREQERRLFVTACHLQAATLAAKEAGHQIGFKPGQARPIIKPEALYGLMGGILLAGYQPNPDILREAEIRGMILIRIPT